MTFELGGPSVAPDLANSSQCQVLVSSVKNVWVVPYVIVICYEFSAYSSHPLNQNNSPCHCAKTLFGMTLFSILSVTLSLSMYKILEYFRDVPIATRSPLMHVLWTDGESLGL